MNQQTWNSSSIQPHRDPSSLVDSVKLKYNQDLGVLMHKMWILIDLNYQ